METALPADMLPAQAMMRDLLKLYLLRLRRPSQRVSRSHSESHDIASSSGAVPELPPLSSADTLVLIELPILSVVLLPSSIEAIDANIVLGLVVDPHAIVVEVLLKQFLSLLKGVVSLLLQDPSVSEAIIASI